MLPRRRGLPLLPGALLLLLDHSVEPAPLFGRQHRAKFLYRPLEFLPPARLHGVHELFRSLLAVLEDFVYRLTLRRRQVQFSLHTPQELDSHYARGRRLRGVHRPTGALWVANPTGSRMPNHQAPGYHTGAEDHHRGEDDFPAIHRVKSVG